MSKVTVISSSNRSDNQTIIFSKLCKQLLEDRNVDVQLYTLQDLPVDLPGIVTAANVRHVILDTFQPLTS